MLIAAVLLLTAIVTAAGLTIDCAVWAVRVLAPAIRDGQRPMPSYLGTWRAYFRERW
jgi:hypothetical protein